MIAICNCLLVKEGAVGQVVERLRTAGGTCGGYHASSRMEVLRSERGPKEEDEVLAIRRWRGRGAFNACVGSEEFCTPSTLAVPRLTVTTVK